MGLLESRPLQPSGDQRMKRIVLFLATNLAVVLVLSVVLRVLRLDSMMASQSGIG